MMGGAVAASAVAVRAQQGERLRRLGALARSAAAELETGFLRVRLQDFVAGAICSILSIAYSLSYATLIFSGPLSQWLGYGIAVGLLSAWIGALLIGLRSSLPIAVAGPDSPTSAVLAVLVAGFVHRLVAQGATEDLLMPAILLMALATALTGAALLVLGVTRAGRAIRFVPYPVIGGFLGATGWLIVVGGAQVTTGQPVTIDSAAVLLSSAAGAKLLAGTAVALALFLAAIGCAAPSRCPACCWRACWRSISRCSRSASRWPRPRRAAGCSRRSRMLGSRRPGMATSCADFRGGVARVGWRHPLGRIEAGSRYCSTPPVKIAARREADLDRELKSHGIANLVIAALGGYISVTSLSRTTVNYLAGATGRLSAITVAAISAAVIAADASFLGYVPKCVLGGLLFYLGADLIYRWLVEFVAPTCVPRISVAARDRTHHHPVGLRRRSPDRRSHRLRHFRVQRQPDPGDQVQFRRLGVSLITRPRARGTRRAPSITAVTCKA